jgi:hypothetical protein
VGLTDRARQVSDDRLPTHVWVGAILRRCSTEGVPATVVHRGERMGGTVMVKVFQAGAGCRLMGQIRNLDGRLGWYRAHKEELVPDPEADALVARAVSRDPDLWVVEVESRDGSNPFEEM